MTLKKSYDTFPERIRIGLQTQQKLLDGATVRFQLGNL